MLVCFADIRPMEFQVGYLALFHLFSVDGFKWFWIGSLMLMLELLKAPFLDLHFFFKLGFTATTRHGVTRKKAQKRLEDTENLFRKNLQLKDLC